jgi:hypothetical protein
VLTTSRPAGSVVGMGNVYRRGEYRRRQRRQRLAARWDSLRPGVIAALVAAGALLAMHLMQMLGVV